MAPQKPKRPSMLTRQRQLRAQQQQVRNASRNQLPGAGSSSGNSRQPRALTAPNRSASKPSSQPASRGGALVRSPGGADTRSNGQPTRPRGGQIEKAGPTIDVKANTSKLSAGSTRPGSNARPALPGGRPGGAIATTTSRATAAAESAAGSAARGLVRGAGRALARGANAAFVIPALVDAAREVVQGTQGNQEWTRRSAALRNKPAGVRTGTASGRTGRGGTTADRMGTRTSADTGRYTPGNQQTDWRGSKPTTRRPASTQSGSSSTPSRGSSSGSGGGSSSSSPTKSSSATPSKIPTANETYRDGGKGLYQGTEEYRNKVGGSGNPLLNRFRKDMGRDEATGDKASTITRPDAPKPGSAIVKDAPNGKQYYGPAYGERSGPAAPASPNTKPDVGYNPKPIKAPDYSSSKTTNRTGTAFSAKQNLLDELRKRRTGR